MRATRTPGMMPSPTTVLRGNTGSGTRAVFARAAKLAQDPVSGRSTFDSELLALAAKQDRLQEPVEIVLVAADVHHALLLPLPAGLTLAAVVAEWETDPRFTLPPDLTVVAGVSGAVGVIEEGEWLIIDPARLRVTVAPDAGMVGRLQGPARPRYRLGLHNEPARTFAGTEIAVWARVFDGADLADALAAGADGFVVDGPGAFLPWDAGENEPDGAALARLLPVAEAAGGGDVALLTSLDAVDAPSLVRLAAHCRLRLLISPDALPLTLTELRAELGAVAEDETDAGRVAAAPRLSALLSVSPRANDPADWHGWEESFLLPFDDRELLTLSLPDVLSVPPMFALLTQSGYKEDGDAESEGGIEAFVSAAAFAGVRGLVVAPGLVRAAKEAVARQE